MAIKWGNVIALGALRAIPAAGGFAAFAATRNRGWSTWGSAFAASGALLVGTVGEAMLEAWMGSEGIIDTPLATTGPKLEVGLEAAGIGPVTLSGLGRTVAKRRIGGIGWTTPGDLRRSGNLYGLRGQGLPGQVRKNWKSKGPLGLIEVRRYA